MGLSPTPAPVAVHLLRPRPRVFGIEADEGMEVRVHPGDARERRLHQIGGGERAVGDGVRRLAKAHGRDLVRRSGLARAGARRGARARVRFVVSGPQRVQRLLEGGGQPVEVVDGANGLDRRVELAELDGQLGCSLVCQRDALALPVQAPDRLAADRHGSLRHASLAAAATLRQKASSHQRRAAPEVDGSTWIAVSPRRRVCSP